jgi:hypothetical protein
MPWRWGRSPKSDASIFPIVEFEEPDISRANKTGQVDLLITGSFTTLANEASWDSRSHRCLSRPRETSVKTSPVAASPPHALARSGFAEVSSGKAKPSLIGRPSARWAGSFRNKESTGSQFWLRVHAPPSMRRTRWVIQFSQLSGLIPPQRAPYRPPLSSEPVSHVGDFRGAGPVFDN